MASERRQRANAAAAAALRRRETCSSITNTRVTPPFSDTPDTLPDRRTSLQGAQSKAAAQDKSASLPLPRQHQPSRGSVSVLLIDSDTDDAESSEEAPPSPPLHTTTSVTAAVTHVHDRSTVCISPELLSDDDACRRFVSASGSASPLPHEQGQPCPHGAGQVQHCHTESALPQSRSHEHHHMQPCHTESDAKLARELAAADERQAATAAAVDAALARQLAAEATDDDDDWNAPRTATRSHTRTGGGGHTEVDGQRRDAAQQATLLADEAAPCPLCGLVLTIPALVTHVASVHLQENSNTNGSDSATAQANSTTRTGSATAKARNATSIAITTGEAASTATTLAECPLCELRLPRAHLEQHVDETHFAMNGDQGGGRQVRHDVAASNAAANEFSEDAWWRAHVLGYGSSGRSAPLAALPRVPAPLPPVEAQAAFTGLTQLLVTAIGTQRGSVEAFVARYVSRSGRKERGKGAGIMEQAQVAVAGRDTCFAVL